MVASRGVILSQEAGVADMVRPGERREDIGIAKKLYVRDMRSAYTLVSRAMLAPRFTASLSLNRFVSQNEAQKPLKGPERLK